MYQKQAAPVQKASVKASTGAVILPNPMTREQFQEALPSKMKKSVNQTLIDSINNTLASPEAIEQFKENLLSYGDVLKEGKFKVSGYINAVKYVSFKLLGCTNRDAYIKTFPNKYQQFLLDGVSEKDIASYTTAFNKSKLVYLIFEQTLVPTHILNAPLLQAAINVQAELMTSATSEKVRSDAAACLIKELKPPETQKFELDVGIKQDDSIDKLSDTMRKLAEIQMQMITDKQMTTTQIAHAPIEMSGDSDDSVSP